MSSAKDRRRKSRRNPGVGDIRIAVPRSTGEIQTIRGRLVDSSDWGVGIDTTVPLEAGSEVTLWGAFFAARSGGNDKRRARVIHSRLHDEGLYRNGCALEEPLASPHASDAHGRRPERDTSITDYYEILQISQNADTDTIQRVYRMLAQRYHPDNLETGDEKAFQVVLQAYRVLSDPEKRAAFDVEYKATRALRWKIFDQPKAAQGIEGEQKKRDGLLSLLYAKMAENPNQPGIMVREFEELLACPRDHLEFTMWYLKKKSLIVGPDNGRYMITAEGVDQVEAKGETTGQAARPMLTEARYELPAASSGSQ